MNKESPLTVTVKFVSVIAFESPVRTSVAVGDALAVKEYSVPLIATV
jgi:hypothetical protein